MLIHTKRKVIRKPGKPYRISTIFQRLGKCTAIVLLTSPLYAIEPASSRTLVEEGWYLVFEGDDIRVHRRYESGSDVVETLTLATIKAPPRQAFLVLTDYTHYSDFMPHVVETRVISQTNNVQLIFQRLRISELFRVLLKDRCHVVKNVLLLPNDGDNHYRIEWSLDAVATMKIKFDNAIATRVNSGYWDLQEIDGGSASRMQYYLKADPGGSIPKSFANEGTLQSIPAVIRAVRDRVHSLVVREAPGG